MTNASDFSPHPRLHDATIPNILKRAGYRTGVIGKPQVAPEDKFQWDARSRVHGRDVKGIAAGANEFVGSADETPLFLMASYIDPHAFRSRSLGMPEITGG